MLSWRRSCRWRLTWGWSPASGWTTGDALLSSPAGTSSGAKWIRGVGTRKQVSARACWNNTRLTFCLNLHFRWLEAQSWYYSVWQQKELLLFIYLFIENNRVRKTRRTSLTRSSNRRQRFTGNNTGCKTQHRLLVWGFVFTPNTNALLLHLY